MSRETRSRLMSRIKGHDTGPELALRAELDRLQLRFEVHAADLPGRPDVVFRRHQVAVFIDGDFWHGFRFPLWEHKLSAAWRAKIAATRLRDLRNFRRLRALGWTCLRLWEHQVERDAPACAARVARRLHETREG